LNLEIDLFTCAHDAPSRTSIRLPTIHRDATNTGIWDSVGGIASDGVEYR